MMGGAEFKIEGMNELVELIKELGDIPQRVVTPAAKDGANVALAAAKALAPVDTGNLRAGIVLVGERKKQKAKKVYQVTMDHRKNDIFVRTSEGGTRYYYPASVEYGFISKKGSKTQGHHFLRNSIDNNVEKIEEAVLDKLVKGIDKELAKR